MNKEDINKRTQQVHDIYEQESIHDPMSPMGSSTIRERFSDEFWNSNKGKLDKQNGIRMNDIVVPVIIKKGDDGQIYFAMQYTYNEAGNKISLELPSIGMQEKKDEYTDLDVLTAITNLTDMLELPQTNGKINELSSNFDALYPSYTDQQAKFVELGVKNEFTNKKGDKVQYGVKSLNWMPVSCLDDLLSRNDVLMSLQTIYALKLFAKKHKEEIEKVEPTKAEINTDLMEDPYKYYQEKYAAEPMANDEEETDYEKIYENKHRFNVERMKIPNVIQQLRALGVIDYVADKGAFVKDSTTKLEEFKEEKIVSLSIADSVQCIVTRKLPDGKVQVAIQKNLRSPFISRGIDEYFEETPAGLIDQKDAEDATSKEEILENAARRETNEETGIDVSPENTEIVRLIPDFLYSHGGNEITRGFLLHKKVYESHEEEQKLDEDEVITKYNWVDLDSLDIDGMHTPISKKLLFYLVQEYFEKEKKIDDKNIEPR